MATPVSRSYRYARPVTSRPLGAVDPAEASTAADVICAALRQRIITGEYAGGSRLTEEQVAGDFQASRMSVREAMRMLGAEGFLVLRPYFGTFVATVGAQQAADLLELQGGLEAMAAGLAAQRHSADDLAELRDLVRQGREAGAGGQVAQTALLHGRFHSVLGRAAGNESLAQVMVQIRYKVDWVYATAVRRPAGDSWEEHSRIVDAIASGEAELAAAAARAHVRHGSQALG